jgi:hypothetical protein
VNARSIVRARRSATAGALMFALASACTAAEVRPDQQDALRFARADVLAARRGAPDLLARAERARADALATADDAARSEHAERARAWLAAAVAESRRIALMRAASAAEARVVAAETRRAELERARVELERETERAAAAASARDQLQRALRLAQGDARPDGARGDWLDGARAADVLRARGRLVLTAAIALGLPAERAAAVAAGLAPRGDQRTARQRLAGALAALARAESALGEARALHGGPTPDERSALLELARERGLDPQETARGVVFALPAELADARLGREARAWLLRIAAVLRAHPHGPVQLEVAPGPGPASAADGSAPARRSAAPGARIVVLLATVTARKRLALTESSAGSGAALVLPAYAVAADVRAVPPQPQACLSAPHAPAR